ncbi:hypothetical protein cypCar_00002570, partial [Cyprinus carpio]
LSPSGIKTKADCKGDELVINGGKMWTTNDTQADWTCLLANTSDGPSHKNKSLIFFPMNRSALYIKGNDVTNLASTAKLKAGRLARELGDSCLQYWGGMGFTSDILVSRFYRDSRLMSTGAGADTVNHMQVHGHST